MSPFGVETLRACRAAMKSRLRGMAQVAKHAMLRIGLVPPPFRIQIDVTDRCNFRCATCSKWKTTDASGELTADQWAEALRSLRGMTLLKEVAISGGEPFLRKDLLDIVGAAKREGLFVVVISNGWLLDGEALERLGRLGVNRLMVSLNSLRAEVHDASRKAPGSDERLMRLVDAWGGLQVRPELAFSTVVMEQNCGELAAMARFVREKGLNGIIYQVLAGPEAHYAFSEHATMPQDGEVHREADPMWVTSVDVLRRDVDELLALQAQGCPVINPTQQLRRFPMYYEDPDSIRNVPCLGALSTLYVDPLGNMRLCYGFPPIGNILRDDPRRVWRSKAAANIRRKSLQCDRLCRMLNNNL
jgi:MoaA/NifB/PqqE/SkfB family radical SAM enzyme